MLLFRKLKVLSRQKPTVGEFTTNLCLLTKLVTVSSYTDIKKPRTLKSEMKKVGMGRREEAWRLARGWLYAWCAYGVHGVR